MDFQLIKGEGFILSHEKYYASSSHHIAALIGYMLVQLPSADWQIPHYVFDVCMKGEPK